MNLQKTYDQRSAIHALSMNAYTLPCSQFNHIQNLNILKKESAISIDDLKLPPGNRLEALPSDRKGQHSIRINQQYRICFRFINGHAEDIEIIDYH